MNSSSSRRVLISAVLLALILPWMSVFAKGYGLIVGIDRYNPRYVSNNLGSCVHDAVGFRHQLLMDVSRWPVANCMMLTNSAATKTAIRTKLAALASTATSGDTVVYFQSSHGGTLNEGGTDTYLCTYNDDYEDSELASDLLAFKSGVKVIIVIDACYAAGLFKSDSTASSPVTRWTFARNVTDKMQSLRVKNVKLSKDASVGWLTACDYAQESWSLTRTVCSRGM